MSVEIALLLLADWYFCAHWN